MSFSPEQTGAALGLLKLKWSDLAKATHITPANLTKWKSGETKFHADTMDKIVNFIDNNGLQATKNGGMEPKPKREIQELYGEHGFIYFMNDVYETVKDVGGDVCVSNVDERNWIKWMGQEQYEEHSLRMKDLSDYSFKIFVKEGDEYFIANRFATYKPIPSEFFNEQSYYAYGNKLALLEFSEDNVHINIIENEEWALSFKLFFNFVWSK